MHTTHTPKQNTPHPKTQTNKQTKKPTTNIILSLAKGPGKGLPDKNTKLLDNNHSTTIKKHKNEVGDITIVPANIKMTIREYCKQISTIEFDN